MKIRPMMNGQVGTYYSDLTTTVTDHVKFESNCYISDCLKEEREPSTGLSFTEDLNYPADKANNNSKTNEHRGVRFSNITIQEYAIEPGVNPGGTKGCPLTIGWKVINSTSVDVDVFEKSRYNQRRNWWQLRLIAEDRQQILREMGYTTKSIVAGTRAASAARRGRVNTIARLKSSDSEEMIESLSNKVHNFVTFGHKKRREQKLLAPYQNDSKAFDATKSNPFTAPRVSAFCR